MYTSARVIDAGIQLGEQSRGDARALAIEVDGNVHDVPDGVVARADHVADEALLGARAVAARRLERFGRGEADAGLLGELEHEHRQ